MVAQGLRPTDVLLDVGCGALRGGVHFIRYLQPGNYLGIEKEVELLRRGVDLELGAEAFAGQRPELVTSDAFQFDRFSKRPTFALAQSLFTHLTPEDINTCMEQLRTFVHPGCRFFATFREAAAVHPNPRRSHAHRVFGYSRQEMLAFGRRHDWDARYIGDWGHPRGQVMVEYTAR
jgi:hypothetical protein